MAIAPPERWTRLSFCFLCLFFSPQWLFYPQNRQLYRGSVAICRSAAYNKVIEKEMNPMFEIDKTKLGPFIAELRRAQGYTQKELAEKLFISDKAVSKWKTGSSIPDTALLIPLADLLGVTVTELLLCRRTEDSTSLEAEQVEQAVKTALTYADERASRAYQVKTGWPLLYICALAVGLAGLLLHISLRFRYETPLTSTILGAVFGAYFCFFVKTTLPPFYDRNKCGLYYDGPFRMNVPGVTFNNSNWPHIVRVGRVWACLSMALYLIISLGMNRLFPALWLRMERYAFLLLLLGGLFLPMYAVGRKHA